MVNVFEAVDVIALIKGGVYDDLNMSVGEALLKRSEVSHDKLNIGFIVADQTRISLAFIPAQFMTDSTPYSTRYESQEYIGSS